MKLLRHRADARTLGFISLFYVLFVVIWFNEPTTTWGKALCVAVMAYLSFTSAVITHNTIHAPIFTRRWMNRAFQHVLTWTYGNPTSAYVPGHNLSHHLHVQTARDVMRTTKLRYRWNLLNQLLFLPHVAGAISKADTSYARAMRTRKPAWFRQWAAEWIVLIVTTVALFILDWRLTLLYLAIPRLFAAWGIVGINFAQHDGADVEHEYNHSRNFVGRLENWLLFNNGFHAIHHEKPSLHWSKLREVHDATIAPHNHPNLNRPSLLGYCFEAYIWPGKRLTYLGEPVVLPPRMKDQPWIPGPKEKFDASLGAVS